MKINIYYGGRGLIDDPTMYVLDKVALVLDELRVQVGCSINCVIKGEIYGYQ